jgi:hypothetical protein
MVIKGVLAAGNPPMVLPELRPVERQPEARLQAERLQAAHQLLERQLEARPQAEEPPVLC